PDQELLGRRRRRQTHDCGRRGMDVPARVRRGGLGRRQESRPPDHPRDRSRAVRHETLRDPLRRHRKDLGAVRRLGLGRQRRVRPARVAHRIENQRLRPDMNTYTPASYVLGALAIGSAIVLTTSIGAATSAADTSTTDPLNCDLSQYKAGAGPGATIEQNLLTVSWAGQGGAEVRARYAIDNGQPIVRDL